MAMMVALNSSEYCLMSPVYPLPHSCSNKTRHGHATSILTQGAILAQIAAIVLLLHRAFKFVVKITVLFTTPYKDDDPAIKDKLKSPSIPKSILNLIQLE